MEFDKDKHEYRVRNKKVLSVTKVLPEIPEHLLYQQSFIEKTLLGGRVHEYANTINQNRMHNTKVKPKKPLEQDIPYIEAYMKFLKENDPVIFESEKGMFHPSYKYAGTVDLVASIGKTSTFIGDIKTSTRIAPYAKLQLAAYVDLWNTTGTFKAYARKIIHLKPDGSYAIVSYPVCTLRVDFGIFICKLKSAQWDEDNMV